MIKTLTTGPKRTHRIPPSSSTAGLNSSLTKIAAGALLLAGAASLLGSGAAQAASWVNASQNGYQCTIGTECTLNTMTPTPVARPGGGTFPENMNLTLLGWSASLSGNTGTKIEFNSPSAGTPRTWHVNINFNDSTYMPTNGDSGYLRYKLNITDGYQFSTAALSTILGGTGTYSTSKKFYQDENFTQEILLWQLKNNEATVNPTSTSISGQTIYVQDDWGMDPNHPIAASQLIDMIQNSYTQVPGPLPLLGAGAAFGWTRRLRGRIKLKTKASALA